jgi:hypothetical protein
MLPTSEVKQRHSYLCFESNYGHLVVSLEKPECRRNKLFDRYHQKCQSYDVFRKSTISLDQNGRFENELNERIERTEKYLIPSRNN